MKRSIDRVFEALARSSFRSRFSFSAVEKAYLERKGISVVMQEGGEFIDKRLAPAVPRNDGRQTPMKNHPFFVAQHATATCCRGCLEKWHGIRRGCPLSEEEKNYILEVTERWIRMQ